MAILVKLQPNQDVTHGLEAAIAAAGVSRARIVAAVGSLVEGVLHRDGGVEIVPGPAIEVAALTGELDAAGGSRLHAYLCQQDAQVMSGELVRGRNAVAVTFELLLEVCDAP